MYISRFKEERAACRAQATKVDRDMPFELRALEAALAAGVRVLEIAVGNLERAAFPALEALIHNVSFASPLVVLRWAMTLPHVPLCLPPFTATSTKLPLRCLLAKVAALKSFMARALTLCSYTECCGCLSSQRCSAETISCCMAG